MLQMQKFVLCESMTTWIVEIHKMSTVRNLTILILKLIWANCIVDQEWKG